MVSRDTQDRHVPDNGPRAVTSVVPDEEVCLDWLWRRRFSVDGVTANCPRCGTLRRFHRLRSRRAYACGRCGHQVFPATDTPFSGSGTRLSAWFAAAQLMLERGPDAVTARALQERLGLEYRTALRMRNRLNQALGEPAMHDLLSAATQELLPRGGRVRATDGEPLLSPRGSERTDQIRAAAARVVAQRGLAYTRVEDIAREAGVSSAIIHYYFRTKKDLLLAALQWAEEEIAAQVDELLRSEADPVRRLLTIVDLSLPRPGFLREEYQLWLEVSVWAREDLAWMARRGVFFRWGQAIREIVSDGQTSGAFASRIPPDVFAERFVALADGLSFKTVFGERGLPIADTRKTLAEFAEEQLGLPLGTL
jgi:AcrR family transcriptional regulator/transposase-like protein